jgi:hypothetical protein
MKECIAQNRKHNRLGDWKDTVLYSQLALASMLRKSVAMGHTADVALCAMMLWTRSETTRLLPKLGDESKLAIVPAVKLVLDTTEDKKLSNKVTKAVERLREAYKGLESEMDALAAKDRYAACHVWLCKNEDVLVKQESLDEGDIQWSVYWWPLSNYNRYISKLLARDPDLTEAICKAAAKINQPIEG